MAVDADLDRVAVGDIGDGCSPARVSPVAGVASSASTPAAAARQVLARDPVVISIEAVRVTGAAALVEVLRLLLGVEARTIAISACFSYIASPCKHGAEDDRSQPAQNACGVADSDRASVRRHRPSSRIRSRRHRHRSRSGPTPRPRSRSDRRRRSRDRQPLESNPGVVERGVGHQLALVVARRSSRLSGCDARDPRLLACDQLREVVDVIVGRSEAGLRRPHHVAGLIDALLRILAEIVEVLGLGDRRLRRCAAFATAGVGSPAGCPVSRLGKLARRLGDLGLRRVGLREAVDEREGEQDRE